MAEAATIARPYAKAAFMEARDTRLLAAWGSALGAASALVADERAAALITDPRLTPDQLVSLFAGLGGGEVDGHWQNFVRILAQNKRLAVLPKIEAQYELLRARYENEVDVEVVSAVAMNADQQTQLAASLKKRFKQDVRMSTSVDPALLGGAVIRAGDLVIDGSISGRLQRLASELAN